MTFDTKIAIVVRDSLAPWQKLNVTAFLAGGLAGFYPEVVGERYGDASGVAYGPLVRQPILVFSAAAEDLARTLKRALERGVVPSIYTMELFTTYNDIDNRTAVAAITTDRLDLAGLALHAERKTVDKIVKGLKLHG
ncbi:MAG TPA: DUF2000 family protein [Nordella sp.]|nr:DUF2000 family protein [Nordella sp.]